MDTHNGHCDIYDLLVALVENDLTDSQRNYLLEWSQTEPNAVEIYHNFLRDYSIISYEFLNSVEYGSSFDSEFDFSLWTALSEHERIAPEVDLPEEKPQQELIEKVIYTPREKRRLNKFQIFTMVMPTAAVIFFMLFIKFAPTKTDYEPVARVVYSDGAEWNQENIPTNRTDIVKGPLTLTEGILKIAMYDGTEVALNAPAEVEFEEISKLYLVKGVIRANVPPVAIGFTVCTPHGSIVDYGTEFSVEVNKSQANTTVKVFKGVVELRDSSNPVKFTSTQRLKAGDIGQIDADHKITYSEPIGYPDREIPTQWRCPEAIGIWTEPSFWTGGHVRGPGVMADFRADDEPKTILINETMTGRNKIKSRLVNVASACKYPVTVQMDGGQVQLEQLWIGRMGFAETSEGRWVMSGGELVLKGRDPVCLHVGDACKGIMEVNGGSVEVFGEAKIGRVGDSTDILAVKAANGTLNMNGGQFKVYGHLELGGMGTAGTIHLSGGQIQAFELVIREKGSFVMSGGNLIIEGDKTDAIQNMINTGLIKSPDHEILVEYDGQGDRGFGSDKTIVMLKE